MTPEESAVQASKPRRDERLVKSLVRAHRWRRRIETGKAKSITDLANEEGVTDAYVCRLLPLTCLAQSIVEAILDGRHPKVPTTVTRIHGPSQTERYLTLLAHMHRHLECIPYFLQSIARAKSPARRMGGHL